MASSRSAKLRSPSKSRADNDIESADRSVIKRASSSLSLAAMEGSRNAASIYTGPANANANDGPGTSRTPQNFGVVVPGVYRSSYPQDIDYDYLQALNLKTIITLVEKEMPESYNLFVRDNSIRHHVFDMEGTKKSPIPLSTMKAILRLVLDQRHHPVLIHCKQGKHRTGCVVAVVRKISGWDVARTVAEYRHYAQPKARDVDVAYIEAFEVSSISSTAGSTTPSASGLPLASGGSKLQSYEGQRLELMRHVRYQQRMAVKDRKFFHFLVLAVVMVALWLIFRSQIAGEPLDRREVWAARASDCVGEACENAIPRSRFVE